MVSKLAYLRIGELLVADGVLTEEQLNEALTWQKKTKSRFGEVLTELGFVREDQVTEAIARQFDHDVVKLESTQIDTTAANIVDFEFASKHLCLPLSETDTRITLAVADPLELEAIDWIASRTRKHVTTVLATPTQLRRAINSVYVLGKAKASKPRRTAKRKDFDALFDMIETQMPAQQATRVSKGAA